MENREMIVIEWVDASMANNTDTYDHEEACKEELIHGFVCGVLVHETREFYTVARDWFDVHNTYRGIATYPKSGIVKVKKYPIFEKEETL